MDIWKLIWIKKFVMVRVLYEVGILVGFEIQSFFCKISNQLQSYIRRLHDSVKNILI